MPLPHDSMLGPYQIDGIIGEGGMGAVYRARDTRLGRNVAIKVLTAANFSDKERLVRFEQESRATGMLNHPNLLTVYDVGRDDEGNPFLVTELLEGETLRGRLARGPPPVRKSIDAALQMANGLAAAHEKGVVHRDLKPDNIFLTRDGRLKILDFGIAKLTGSRDDGPTFQMAATEPGMVLGTVGYMSPEQVRGEPVDHRSDLFSLGAIVYEMLSGTRAFRRDSSIETLTAILKEEPPDLTDHVPNLPAPLDRLVRRCMEKDREHRFQSAGDLAFNLETLSSMSSLSPTPNLSGTPRAPAGRGPAYTGTSAVPTDVRAARATTTVRPAMKPKRRVSPALLAILYLVSIGGAAYGGWRWAQSRKETPPEPQYRRLTFRRGEVRTARFTPDGETIAYTASWDGRAPEIFVASRGSAEARPLGVTDAEILAISRSAEAAVLLRRDRITSLGTLARVPLAGGMPREVAESVLQADWSPDGSNLAILRQSGDKVRVEYPIGTVRYETVHFVRDLRVSPDGKRIAILEPSRGEYDLAIIENGAPVTVARGWGRGATGLAWSADGREIWVSGTSSSAPPALFAVDVETGEVRLVTRLTGVIRMFDLSRRGEALLSNGSWRAALVWKVPEEPAVEPRGGPVQPSPVEHLNAARDLPGWVANPADGSIAPTFDRSREQDVSWYDWSVLADLSPDGKTILFSETREGGGAKSAVYLRRADEPAPVRLGDGIGDALSPDGKWVLAHQGSKLALIPTGTGQARELNIAGSFESGGVFFPDSRRVLVGGNAGQGGYRLWVIDTLDEKATPVSPENVWSGGSRAWAVSPDGRRVAGMSAEETIAIYPVDGGAPVPVAGTEKGEIPIQFSADGAALFVYRAGGVPARLYRVSLTDGTRELWKEFTPADPAGVYKIAPALLTPDGRGWAYNAMRVTSDLYVAEGLR